jgi:hypothetical protein
MEEKLRFAIREGGRTVGAGVVAEHHRVTTSCHGRARARAIHVFEAWPATGMERRKRK